MFDMQAYMRVYLRAYKATDTYRAYERGYRAELRSRGLCIECREISVKFTRCNGCRARAAANRGKARLRLTLPPDVSRLGTS